MHPVQMELLDSTARVMVLQRQRDREQRAIDRQIEEKMRALCPGGRVNLASRWHAFANAPYTAESGSSAFSILLHEVISRFVRTVKMTKAARRDMHAKVFSEVYPLGMARLAAGFACQQAIADEGGTT
jgi:hypothetical protein